MGRPGFADVDAYIAAQPPPARPVLETVRAAIRQALPTASEGISYQIPIYRVDGAMVLFFAGFKSHYSIFPAVGRMLTELKSELRGRVVAKTLRFPLDEPVPVALITRIAKIREREARALQQAKSSTRQAQASTKKAPRTAAKKAPKKAAKKAPKKAAKSKRQAKKATSRRRR